MAEDREGLKINHLKISLETFELENGKLCFEAHLQGGNSEIRPIRYGAANRNKEILKMQLLESVSELADDIVAGKIRCTEWRLNESGDGGFVRGRDSLILTKEEFLSLRNI